jgi:SurA-like N-terminal domain
VLIVKKIKILYGIATGWSGLFPAPPGQGDRARVIHRSAGWVALILGLVSLWGCGPPGSEPAKDYLIRIGERKVTVREFLQAFELTRTAYPGGVAQSPAELKAARTQLLNEMATELVMFKRAGELGIFVSDAEFEAAVAAVRSDYPPGVFEQTLIESAVSFDAWKHRLRSRLLMEKLVDAELRGQIAITPEDVAGYYDQHYRNQAAGADSQERLQRLKETIVAELQRQKIEDAYGAWITRLKEKYPVDINQEAWGRLEGLEPGVAPGDGT